MKRAELRVYASYVSSGATVPVTVVGVDDDQWTEAGLTWNRAPGLGDGLDRIDIRQKGAYVFDVTPFVASQLAGDHVVSLALLDARERNWLVNFWSREARRNPPVLTLTYGQGTPVENEPPVADLAAFPEVGAAPLTVVFDGSASTDADGQRLAYDWDFGDGTSASGAVVQHTYTEAGAYPAQLTVTDTEGASALADTLITVEAVPRRDELVANGGFENVDGAGKPYDWRLGTTGAWRAVNAEASHGSYSLQLEGAERSRRTPIASALTVGLEAGRYTLCAHIATDQLGTQDGRRRGVRVSLKDESIRQGSGNIASTPTIQGTHDWHCTCEPVAVQRDGDYTVRIEAINKPNGWAWVDAVSLLPERR